MPSNLLSCEDAIELLDRLHIPTATVEVDYTFSFVNREFCNILNAVPEQIIGRTFQSFTFEQDIEPDTQWADRLISGEADYYKLGKRYVPFGSNKENPILVYGVLYVWASRDQNGDFRKFLVAFDPQKKISGLWLNPQTLKATWLWAKENKKTILWVLLVIASLTGIGQTQLLELLLKVNKAKSTVEQLEQSESLPLEP